MIPPRQIHPSWYRRFWYDERSPPRALLDRVLIFGIVALLLLAGATHLAQRDSTPRIGGPSDSMPGALR